MSKKLFELPMGYVFDENNKVLLLKRIDRKSREPVKGGINDGETPKQAIVRELYEETSLRDGDIISMKDDGARVSFEGDGKEIRIYVFFFKVKGTSPKIIINHVEEGGVDHDDYGWFTLEELDDLHVEYRESIVSEIRKCLDSFTFKK